MPKGEDSLKGIIINDNVFGDMYKEKGKSYLPPGGVFRWEWERMLIDNIFEMLSSRFIWKGLPPEAPPLYMETTLNRYGNVLLFEDPTMGYMMGTGTFTGFNHYDQPLNYTVVSAAYNRSYSLMTDKAAMIRNNSEGDSDMDVIRRYVKIMAEIKMTKQINMNTLKTPHIVATNDNTRASMIKQMDQIDQGATRIIVDTKLNKEKVGGITVHNTNAPYYLDKLEVEYKNVKQELFEFYGINTNPQVNKTGGVSTGETQANNQEIGFHLLSQYEMRVEGAKKASEVLGREITVEMRGYDDIASVLYGSDSVGLPNGSVGSVGKPNNQIKSDEKRTS